ncbi:MAG: hypothetical protein KAS87_05360 [Candidatus Omnitrophica bacterium]|nr:hypothetical protein [Candidatus Omnitrophota bacterium]
MIEKNDNYLNFNVTHSSMGELLSSLKEKEEISNICKERSLNIILLKNLFFWSAQGFNNVELARKLGVHRVTVQRYSSTLKKMKVEEYHKLFNYISKGLRNGV